MTASRLLRLLAVLSALCIVATACGSAQAATEEVDAETSETVDYIEAIRQTGISEQDLEEARRVLDAAKAQWESNAPFAYMFSAGRPTTNLIEIDFDIEGNAGRERVIFGNSDSLASLPRSVDEAFDAVEALLVAFESGELEVPDLGECGQHFRATFDPELGFPRSYTPIGPCGRGPATHVDLTEVSK